MKRSRVFFFPKQTRRFFLAKVQVFGCWQAGKSFLYIVSYIDQAIPIKAIAGLLIRPWRLRLNERRFLKVFSWGRWSQLPTETSEELPMVSKFMASINLLSCSESFSQNILYTNCTVPKENNSAKPITSGWKIVQAYLISCESNSPQWKHLNLIKHETTIEERERNEHKQSVGVEHEGGGGGDNRNTKSG